MIHDFLPTTRADMEKRGWDELDFLYISGDAYVDHPSFGHAIITRVIEARGYRVGIIALPDWKSKDDFLRLGTPKYGVFVGAGNIDSMVNHYTVSKKQRSDDAYAPGNVSGKRPDRATIVYCNRIREAFPGIPLVIGGIEASLRRFAHYDYWDDKIRRSLLFDSRADLLIYGMGEKQTAEIADRLAAGENTADMTDIAGTCYASHEYPQENALTIPSYEECTADKKAYAESCRTQYYEQNPFTGKTLVQKHGDRYLIQNPPAMPLEEKELDAVYALPYMRNYHPMYKKDGGIKALYEVKFSVAMNRGCFGNCNFCALAFHQGRIVTSRSDESVIEEVKQMVKDPDFKGNISDVGGPTANFRECACEKQMKYGACKDKQCLYPTVCTNMKVSHKKYLDLLRKIRSIDGVKRVFIRSGIRYDYLMADKDEEFFYELCKYHISGQLRVAPEHISDNVLRYMGKPSADVYDSFAEKFYEINKKTGKEQFIVPYLMSGHPGSTLRDAVRLAEYLHEHKLNPEQVQDFYPTPGTISTCMYYTGLDPMTMKEVYIPRTPREKAMQRALLQYRDPKNYKLVYEALVKCGRQDLIGYHERCLIRPPKGDILSKRRNSHGNDTERKRSFRENKGRGGSRNGSTQRGRDISRSRGNNSR